MAALGKFLENNNLKYNGNIAVNINCIYRDYESVTSMPILEGEN